MTPIVLIHGGGFDARCWDLVLPHLGGPALAVDLPGRGSHPAPLGSVTFSACADAVAADVAAAGFDEVVLVGHSLAGCSIPSIAERLRGQVRGIVFVAASVPPDGQRCFDTLDPGIQALIEAADPDPEPTALSGDLARLVLGDDLDEQHLAWCVERMVAEAPGLTTERVSHDGLAGVPLAWVRTTQDLIVPPDKQLDFAAALEDCAVVDIHSGHMVMVSQPAALARTLMDLVP